MTLARLAEAVREVSLEEPALAPFDPDAAAERHALVDALRLLVDLGVLSLRDGDAEGYARGREGADALYDVQERLLGQFVSAPLPPALAGSPERMAEEERAQTEDGERLRARQHVFRLLLEDPVVYLEDLDPRSREWLGHGSGFVYERLEEDVGLRVERRRQRAADERAREQADGREAAREALARAEQAAEEAWESWAGEVDRWREGLAELPGVSVPALEAGAREAEPAELRQRVEALAAPVRQAIADAAACVRGEAGALEARRAGVQADRDALARARHPLPPAPVWRVERPPERPGAPLYALCEFGPDAAGKEAALEAALEAAGLLDAWVEPDGTLLDAVTGEVFLRGAGAAPGRSLADVLLPVAAAMAAAGLSVPEERLVEALLGDLERR